MYTVHSIGTLEYFLWKNISSLIFNTMTRFSLQPHHELSLKATTAKRLQLRCRKMTRPCQCLKFHSAFHVAITSRSFSLNFCKVKMAKKQAAAAVENCTRLHKNDWIRDRLLAFFAIHVFLHKIVETKKSVSGWTRVNLRMSVKVLGQFWWSFSYKPHIYIVVILSISTFWMHLNTFINTS